MPRNDFAGVYSTNYYSGSQVAIYIGDVLVDEVTSITFQVEQSKKPLYGYADQYFREVSKGQVLVQGSFTINFKEAGYLFLILDRYQSIMNGRGSLLKEGKHTPSKFLGGNTGPFMSGGENDQLALQDSIEAITNNDKAITGFERLRALEDLAYLAGHPGHSPDGRRSQVINQTSASLRGFSSVARSQRAGLSRKTDGGAVTAEAIFEAFEDKIWQVDQKTLDEDTRRADDSRLNPFDIYIAYGDFKGPNTVNHTIHKLSDVHILGSSRQIVVDGQPIQEAYSFIARNLV